MEKPEKMYYTIGEVAELLNLNTSKLRFYEQEFPALTPQKRKGQRIYTPNDIKLLRDILALTNEQGYTLSGAREYLSKRDARQREIGQHLSKLNQMKVFLENLRDSIP